MTVLLPPADHVLDALRAARSAIGMIDRHAAEIQAAEPNTSQAESDCLAAMRALQGSAQQVMTQFNAAVAALNGALQQHLDAALGGNHPGLRVIQRTDALRDRVGGLPGRLSQLSEKVGQLVQAVGAALESAEERLEALPEEAHAAVESAIDAFQELPGELEEALQALVDETLGTAEDLAADRVEASFNRVGEVLGELVANEIAEAITIAMGSTTLSQILQPYLPQMIVVQQGLPVLKKILSGGL